jgi:DNA-binding NtrC family response regulator
VELTSFIHHVSTATLISAPIPALVVEAAVDDLVPLVSALTEAGFQVTAAGTFLQARTLLDARPPALLMTAVRLGLYNGLHLVLRGTAVKPDLAAVVTSTVADPVLQREAEALGATFVVTPVEQKDLVAAVLRTLFRTGRFARPSNGACWSAGHSQNRAYRTAGWPSADGRRHSLPPRGIPLQS